MYILCRFQNLEAITSNALYKCNVDHQDIRQCRFPGDQNRAEDRYEEEVYNPNEEGQHVFQSLSPN